MFEGADPLSHDPLMSDQLTPSTEAKVSPERALGILLLAMLAVTVLLLVRTH